MLSKQFALGCALGFGCATLLARLLRRLEDDEGDEEGTETYRMPDDDETAKSDETPKSIRMLTREMSMRLSEGELTKMLEAKDVEEEAEAIYQMRAPLTRAVTDYGDEQGTLGSKNKVVICMVGLPARGKSYLVKMLLRYLSWLGFPTKIFNVGDMRRRLGMGGVSSDFFRNDDAARRSREDLAMACQEEMYAWLDAQKSSCLAIFDATNTTKARRLALLQRSKRAGGCGVTLIFVESICDDEEILAQNYRMKLGNADYTGQDPESALADFLKRVEEYEARYEAVGDDENGGDISYVKIINVGEKVITRRCSGYLSSQISFYLGNIHIQPRRIWLSLHAESVDNIKNVLGASSGELTIKGAHYANALSAFIQREHSAFVADHAKDLHEDGLDVLILSGNAPVHHSTVAPLLGALRPKHLHTSLLNELCGGDFDGLSVAELERKYPGVWKARNADKLRFRYPGAGGESYLDVIARLRPILIELERERQSVLLVAHMAVLRCLYAYFVGTPVDQIPYLRIPSGAVVELTPTPHGTTVRTFNLIPAVAIPPTDRARYDDVTP